MAFYAVTALQFAVGNIVLINAKELCIIWIHSEIHDLFLELNALYGEVIRTTSW